MEKPGLYITDQHAWPDKTVLLQSAWSTALEQFIYLYVVAINITRDEKFSVKIKCKEG